MKRGKASRMMVRVWAVLFSVIWLFPVYWMVLTALKPSQSVLESSPHVHHGASVLVSFSEGGRIAIVDGVST